MKSRGTIETERLILRGWRDGDRAAFHAMNSDAHVMATIGPVMERAQTDADIDKMIAANRKGAGLLAIERRADQVFLGFCGIGRGPEGTPIAGEPEIGWRLIHHAWGQGFAREAAMACLDWGWVNLTGRHIVAITAATNTRSWGLMERLGMTRYPDEDFDHPRVPDGSPLKRHIVYRIARPAISRRAKP